MDTVKKKKRLYDFFNSIRFIIMLTLASACTLVTILSVVISYTAYRESLLNTIGANRSDVLSQVGSHVRDFKRNIYTVSNLYYNDARFRQYVQNLTEGNAEEFYTYMDGLTRQYQVSFNQVNLDYYVVYISENGIGYCSQEVPEDYDYMNPKIRIWYRDVLEAGGEIIDVACYKDKYLGERVFLAVRTVLNAQGEVIGYLCINANEQQLFNMYEEIISPESNVYIADNEGYIISSSESKIVGFQYFNMMNLERLFEKAGVYAVVEMPKEEVLFSKYMDEEYHFTVFEEIPVKSILEPIQQTRTFIAGVALTVILAGLVLAWLFSGTITRPILKMRDCVDKGGMDAVITLDSYTELNSLSSGIQQMLGRIHELVERIKKKEKQKRKMQYKLLQAQINPHFMYNTLFSIKCVVEMNDNQRASDMLSAFIQLLRSVLSNPDAMTTIRYQMENLEQYAQLQRFRFGEEFEFLVEYEEEIENARLPSLLIQPLVENALRHGGIGHFYGNGIIVVSAHRIGENIDILVEDNGVGMSKERICEVFSAEADDSETHIGIKNINDRIQLAFGEEYGLEIKSAEGEGTTVLIHVPLLLE
jgi:sensor histidine kinase YesM